MTWKKDDELFSPAGHAYPRDVFKVTEVRGAEVCVVRAGGGFVRCAPIQKLKADGWRTVTDEDKARREFYEATFDIDGYHKHKGWTDGTRWNGWATPHFEKPAADLLVTEFNSTDGCIAHYDPERDAYVFAMEECEDEPDVAKGEIIQTPTGPRKVYAIGDGWTWDSDEDS